MFCPLTFLPLVPDVCLARILSFGYNADFRKAGNISTAKELLYDLQYTVNEKGDDLNMGNVSEIYVVSPDIGSDNPSRCHYFMLPTVWEDLSSKR